MRFSNDEYKLMLGLLANGPDGAPVPIATLAPFFDRPCKLRHACASLERWQLITVDPYQNVARLLVQPVLRALTCGPAATQPEMFPHERPLDASLAETCATAAAFRPPETPIHNPRLNNISPSPGQERAGVRSFQTPPPCVPEHKPRVPEHAGRIPEHNSEPPHINVKTLTFNRNNVLTIKRSRWTTDQLQTEIETFVGEDDFHLHWSRAKFWADQQRCEILEKTLRGLRAGLKSGEIQTKKTAGKHLWFLFRTDCRIAGIEALV